MSLWSVSLFVCILCATICGYDASEHSNPIVRTTSGRVKGSFLTSRTGRRIYSFRSIRYGIPPVGRLRFKPPVEYTWNGVYDATEDGPMCPQPFFNTTSEDCLRLNVYTPKLPEGATNRKLPVIFFIHDGAFYAYSGTYSIRGPEYFLDNDVILVTINYRLGMLGFLSTGDAEAQGNYGMKDQVLALKWIRKNIEAFGGDKDRITLMGYSAGGASVTLHMLSPMTRGLFQNAIVMSGSAFGALPISDSQLEVAKKQASLVGCPSDTSRNIVTCLRTKTANEIANSLPGFAEIGGNNPVSIMYPVIEKDCGDEPYITDHPIRLIEQKKFYDVPMLAGRNKDELAFKAFQLLENATATKMANDDFERYFPLLFSYDRRTAKSREASRAIKKFYLNDQPISNVTVSGLADVFADSLAGFSTHRAVELLAKHGNKSVYYYDVTYLGGVTDFYLPGSNGTIPYGVVHQDELTYMFYISLLHPLFDETNYPVEARSSAKLTKLLANFAATGNPTPQRDELFNNIEWEKFNLQSQKYLDIGETLQMKERMFQDRYNLWNRMFPVSDYLV